MRRADTTSPVSGGIFESFRIGAFSHLKFVRKCEGCRCASIERGGDRVTDDAKDFL